VVNYSSIYLACFIHARDVFHNWSLNFVCVCKSLNQSNTSVAGTFAVMHWGVKDWFAGRDVSGKIGLQAYRQQFDHLENYLKFKTESKWHSQNVTNT
jgi:hypothetical protein